MINFIKQEFFPIFYERTILDILSLYEKNRKIALLCNHLINTFNQLKLYFFCVWRKKNNNKNRLKEQRRAAGEWLFSLKICIACTAWIVLSFIYSLNEIHNELFYIWIFNIFVYLYASVHQCIQQMITINSLTRTVGSVYNKKKRR